AFRRLSGKMQVFTGEMGDYHRTRLTHTQEVASLARTVGRALRLNEDLIEALALLHDIGHPPYGHAGEDALHEVLAPDGAFSHNQFALTIVEELEQRYAAFPGLNLSFEVLESQHTRIDKADPLQRPLLEAQVVDAADSITYDAHDTDDAVKLGLLTLDELAETTLVREALEFVHRTFTISDETQLRVAVVHQLIERQVTDILGHCVAMLSSFEPSSSLEARQIEGLVGTSSELAEQKQELEAFLYARVYRHPDLIAVRERAQARLQRMFHEYQREPSWFPEKYQRRAERVGVRKMAVDYLAGMTDRFCDDRFHEMFPGEVEA
ncbi:MAG: HD domain-containing protein, partial [Planctomycetales bacterium]|nr:HD domain-containing protein [Planctomycetales bacterium]